MKKFLSEYPELISEWHPTKNGELKPEEFTHGSDNKVWWLCPKGHDYNSSINGRTRKDKSRGCPYCSGIRVGKDNNLKVLFPKIAKEWHPTKNGDSKPEEFTGKNSKKVWWLCPKGHPYDSIISGRTRKDRKPEGCPYCSGNKVSEENSLLILYPKVSSEWHSTKNGDLKPEDFSFGSGKKVWWLCPKGHSYDSTIGSRTSNKPQSCPYCSGNKVSNENNLKHLFPKVAAEWHPTKNGSSRPEEFTSRSNRKVWWLCPKGHDYDSTINNRTGNDSSCPYCSNQTSSPELRILAEFRFIFDDVKTRHKIDGVEMDVYVPKFNIAIEYDGSRFHQGKEQKDLEKNEFLQKRNIEVFRVRCRPLTKITKNDLIVKNDDLLKSDLNRVFKILYSFVDTGIKEKINEYIDSDNFLNENGFREYLSYLPSPLPENSITTKFPNLISEWDYEKNHPLIPDQFSKASHNIVWWLCLKGHSYDARVYTRTGNKPQNCPYCSGRRVSNQNNLLLLFPKVASEWHPTKNGELKPDEFTYGSAKKVWWLCPKGHSYDSIIKSRTGKQQNGCPYCSGQKVSEENNLKFLFPKIADEWHPNKNGDIKPEGFAGSSNKKVWWLCPKGHDYYSKILNRTSKNKSGCPHCYTDRSNSS